MQNAKGCAKAELVKQATVSAPQGAFDNLREGLEVAALGADTKAPTALVGQKSAQKKRAEIVLRPFLFPCYVNNVSHSVCVTQRYI